MEGLKIGGWRGVKMTIGSVSQGQKWNKDGEKEDEERRARHTKG